MSINRIMNKKERDVSFNIDIDRKAKTAKTTTKTADFNIITTLIITAIHKNK